jgi:hypothetical protein
MKYVKKSGHGVEWVIPKKILLAGSGACGEADNDDDYDDGQGAEQEQEQQPPV